MFDALKTILDTFKGFFFKNDDDVIKSFSVIATSAVMTGERKHDLGFGTIKWADIFK